MYSESLQNWSCSVNHEKEEAEDMYYIYSLTYVRLVEYPWWGISISDAYGLMVLITGTAAWQDWCIAIANRTKL